MNSQHEEQHMYDYTVFFDVTDDWSSESIEVVQSTVQAKNAREANQEAFRLAKEGMYEDIIKDKLWHLWEITECDRVVETVNNV